jgi:hypothetical protein
MKIKKIKFTAEGGWDSQKKEALELLEVGKYYNAIRGDVRTSSSCYYLEGFGDTQFNTCLFEEDDIDFRSEGDFWTWECKKW